MKILLMLMVVETFNLLIFAWFNRVAVLRILALRQQLTVYKRKSKKAILKNRDRLFWSLLSRFWKDRKSELILVRPETVIRWRKRKFQEFWRKRSQGRRGNHFFAYAVQETAEEPARFYFRRPSDGVTIGFSAEEWHSLKSLISKAMKLPALQKLFTQLSLVYGEL
jgi:hypothetical protein